MTLTTRARLAPCASSPTTARHRVPVAVTLALALVVACSGDDTGPATSDTATTTDTTTTTGATMTSADSSAATTGATESTSSATTIESTSSDTTSEGTTMATTMATTGDTDTDTDSTTNGFCPAGAMICEDYEAKICDGMGGYSSSVICDEACTNTLGCVLCVPGATRCEGDASIRCSNLGDAWEIDEICDAVQGLSCDLRSGLCQGACAKASLGRNSLGCEFYPTVTPQFPDYQQAPHEFAITVSNTADAPATITITQGDKTILTDTIAAAGVKVIPLPWVKSLSAMDAATDVYAGAAYRVRTDQPVAVYQYNPLDPTYSQDASLLLPAHAWTGSLLVASWPHRDQPVYPGFYAVVARHADTTVTLSPSATGSSVSAGGGVNSDGTGMITIQAGDVLLVRSDQGGDLTGTIITADKPVQVIGGHGCANVPVNVSHCDHLEESMFPIEALGTEYVIVPAAQIPTDYLSKGENVRIIASEDDTTLTYLPNQQAAKTLAKAGDFIEIELSEAEFTVKADKKIAVAQYMVGDYADLGPGDPSMTMAVPTSQYRTSYVFHAPTSWASNYVAIIAPNGTEVTLDGKMVTNFTSVFGTDYSYQYAKLVPFNGTHRLEASGEVAISVYGGQAESTYWYPGGLDLAPQ